MRGVFPRTRRALSAAAALLMFSLAPLGAATVSTHNTWLYFSFTGPLLGPTPEFERWRFSFDSPNRFTSDSRHYAQGTWRSALGYTLSPHWSAWAGYGYSRTGKPYTSTPYGEHRPFQQLVWTDRAGDFTLKYRLRLEERMPDTGDDLGLRLRHQLRISHPLAVAKPLSWIAWGEVFLNLNTTDYGARQGVDQYRGFAGLGWKWSDRLRSEAGYLRQFAPRPGQADRVIHVLALNLALTLK